MSYQDVFGNNTLPPSEYGYSALNLTDDQTVVWPYNADSTSVVISKIVNVICLAGNVLTLPDATQVSTGEDFLLRNVGANPLTVNTAGGTTVATVAAGAASYFYLTDNTTTSGTFGVIGFGVGTSTADAGSLIGYGIKAIGNTLNQSHPTLPTASGITIDSTHRAKLVVFTGGADTFPLTSAATLGDDYFVLIRNEGTGTLNIDPASSELIDGMTSMQVQPGESLILLCTGTQWYSVGYGRSTLYQFTQLTKDVSAGGTITLTAAEAANKLMTFIGNPSGAVTVIVPAVVAVYYTYSNISTPHVITFKTSAGTGIDISQNDRIIALCDGTNILAAQSATASSSLSLIDGSAAIPALFFASQTNTGIYKYGTSGLGITVGGISIARFTPTGIEGGSASMVSNIPAGNISSTNVQAALNELDTEKQTAQSVNGMVKSSGTTRSAAVAGTDYLAPPSGTSILKADSGGALANAVAGTDYLAPGAIGITIQAYDVDTAKTDVAQNFTASQRSAPITDNDLSFDLSGAGNNYTCTWTGAGTLTFTNMASNSGKSGWIKFVQLGTGTVAAAANSKISAANLTKLGTAGTYIASYYCDGTDVYVGIGVYS